jgi:amidase
MKRGWIAGAAACALALAACQQDPPSPATDTAAQPASFDALAVEARTIVDAIKAQAAGEMTSHEIVRAYLQRIAEVDDAGPQLNAVIALNPNAEEDATAIDESRAEGTPILPLQGVPILIKDNIDVTGMANTAGSLALRENVPAKDAPVIARLRAAGAVILGKTNLSEWANYRDGASTSGWSAVGGLTKNPHDLSRNPCGSSSGSGAAIAAGLASAALGTETDGSVTCPAGQNGIVGIKPTVGLVSRTGIIPISASQDTAGPMTLTVEDAAILLTVMAGSDPADPATAEADAKKEDYAKALNPQALKGARIGVARFEAGYHKDTDAAFDEALAVLKAQGAELVEIRTFDGKGIGAAENRILQSEFKAGINAYLAGTPDAVKTRTLDDLIAFNRQTPEELRWFGQSIFEEAANAPALTDAGYLKAKADGKRLAGPEGIDKLLKDNNAVALVAPTGGPAWTTDLVTGDHFLGSASGMAAVAGYPHITVPMGMVVDLPVGLSFIGPAWGESRIIGLAYAYEQATKLRATPRFRASTP